MTLKTKSDALLHRADDVQEHAALVIVEVRQVVRKIGEAVADTDLRLSPR